MCCLLLVLALLGPRVAFLGTWLFSDRVQTAFSGGWLWPILGLLFLPWTALMFVLAYAPVGGVSPLGWFVVALGFIADLGTYGSRDARRRYSASSA